MSKVIEQDDGTVITKTDDNRFIVESWGTAQVRDNEGQELPVEEIVKDVPNMMKFQPQIHLSHTDTPLGPILDVQRTPKETKKGTKDALRIKYEILSGRRYLEAARRGVEKGIYGAVSLKGYSYDDPTYRSDDDGVTEIPHDIEVVSWALCKKGMNPETGHISINGKDIKKGDDDSLMEEPEFVESVRKLLFDGLPYSKAVRTAKEMFSGNIAKELVKEDEVVKEIHKRGDKWIVTSKGGKKVLGTHESKSDALKQLAAVEAKKEDTVQNTAEQTPVGVEKMTDEELNKELESLKEKYEALEKENKELKDKLDKGTDDPEEPEEEPEEPENKVEKGNEPDETDKEAVTLNKEDLTKLKEDIKKSVVEDMSKNKDELLKALGLNKVEDKGNTDMLNGIVKSAEDGTKTLDFKKLYEMTKQGEEQYRNSDLDSIPDIEKSIKELYGE